MVSRAYLRGGHLITALPQHLERLGAGEQVVGVVHLHLELRTRREEGRFGDVSDAAGGERRVGGGRDTRRGCLAGRDRGSRRAPGTCPPSIPPPSGALRPTPWRRAERHPLLGIRVSTRATSGGRPDRRCASAVTTGSSRTSRPETSLGARSGRRPCALAWRCAHAASADRTPRPIRTSERKHPRKIPPFPVPRDSARIGGLALPPDDDP